jgi:hypothetical protein
VINVVEEKKKARELFPHNFDTLRREVDRINFDLLAIDEEDNFRVLAGVRREEGKGELEFFDRHVDSIRVNKGKAREFSLFFSSFI